MIVHGSGEDLRLLRRDGGVSLDHGGEYAAQCFNAEGQRRHVEKQYVLHFAFQHACLNGRTYCDGFIGIDALVRFLAEFILDEFLHGGDTGRAVRYLPR